MTSKKVELLFATNIFDNDESKIGGDHVEEKTQDTDQDDARPSRDETNWDTDIDIKNDEGHTLLDESLPLPYAQGIWFSKFKYMIKSVIVRNPRLFSLFLLYKSIWPRLLVGVDMYTDGLVAIQLFKNNNPTLFTLTILFLSFPFIMVWNASLRLIQKDINSRKYNKFANTLLLLYIFPPIGCLVVTIY